MGEFEGKRALIIQVIPESDGDEVEFELVNIGDVIEIRIDGKKICSGDWTGNFAKLFKEALKEWG